MRGVDTRWVSRLVVPTPTTPPSGPVAPALRAVQLYLGLTAVVVPLASWIKQAAEPSFVNPIWAYAGLSAVAAALFALSARQRRLHPRFRLAVVAFAAVELAWLTSLLTLNAFDPDIAGGYIVVVLAVGSAFAVGFDGVSAALWLTAGAVVGVAVAGLVVVEPEGTPWVWVVLVASTGAFQVATAATQNKLTVSLRQSRELYAAAEAAGGIGSWVVDLETGATRWSDGMCALLGVPPLGMAPAPSVEDYVYPEDLAASRAAFEAVARGDLDEHAVSVRVRAADARERTLRGVVRAERGDDGEVARVVGVATDVTEQAAHQAELVEARDRAEAAARLKEAILANMSHEIRTPLTAVIGYAELLAEVADAETVPLVEPIVGGGQRLLDTLNSVLDLARLEAEGAALVLRPVELGASAEAARAALAETAARAGLTLGVESVSDVWARADPGALGRVLDNLVANAIRFTETGGVTLRLSALGGAAVVEVIDTGRGMSPAFAERAAEPFVQESAGDARSHEGSGLGLSIVSRLVGAMGGELAIASAPGAGTTVRVTLPLASAEAVAAPAPEPPVWVARRRLAAVPARA